MDSDTPKKKNWFRRLLIIAAVVLVAGALTWFVLNKTALVKTGPAVTPQTSAQVNSSGATASPGARPGVTSGSVAGSENKAEEGAPETPGAAILNTKMTIAGSKVTVNPDGGAVVTGQITNNQGDTKSAKVQATFYDKSGGVLGKATGSVTSVAPDETKTFKLTTVQNVSAYDRAVVEVTSIY